MIFRLTQKLARKIAVSPPQRLPLDENPFADWSANLFTAQRTQYILLTNTASLYSMLMYGRGITDDNEFIQLALACIREFMLDDGKEFLLRRHVAPQSGIVAFSKTGDRGVLGSMNDLVSQAKLLLITEELSPFDASRLLNEAPMSYLGYSSPREALTALKIKATG